MKLVYAPFSLALMPVGGLAVVGETARKDERPFLNVILTLVFQAALSATAFAAGRGAAWGLLTLPVALTALGVAYGLRRSDVR